MEENVMAKDYTNLVNEIIANIGGKQNVTSAFHCATRLRFQLKDMKVAEENKEKIKNCLRHVHPNRSSLDGFRDDGGRHYDSQPGRLAANQ